jgi:UDP-N-acetylmuramyl pentapeptide synthase
MEVAIRAFGENFPNGILVLGDMKELGKESTAAHQQIMRLVLQGKFSRICFVGDEFSKAASEAGLQNTIFRFAKDIDELKSHWNWEDCPGQAMLIKGSRSMRLEQLLAE